MQLNFLKNTSFHISEGNPEKCMLYRYGVLAKDETVESNDFCKIDGETICLSAKRIVEISVEKKAVGYRLSIPMGEKERFFGAGDSTRKSVALRGQLLKMNIQNVIGYGPMPIFLSTDGWAFVLNCTYASYFDFGTKNPDLLTIDVTGGEIDFYLFKGDSLLELIKKITDITGKPLILPKFAYGLTFVQNEQIDTRGLLWDIRTLRDLDIPCDTMGLEPAWMDKHYDFSTDKKWSKERFYLPEWKPDNQSDYFSFFYAMRRMGMQLSLWLCENYDLFYEEEKIAPLKKEAEEIEAQIVDQNLIAESRIDQITKIGEPWFEHLKKFVDNGAAAFKLDGATQVLHHPDRLWAGKFMDDEVHNVYPVILAKQMTNGFREYTDRRLLLYTSGAFTGTQQYAATWAGDTGGGADTVVSVLNYAMCGHSNATCDIDVTPEALHYGFLLPWAQYFCWANWRYPWFMGDEIENTVRFYAKLRSSLFPYLYAMAYKAYSEAVPMVRPLPLMYETEDRFDDVKNAYMLGDSLYVGVFDMNLKLPEGKWIDYFTGQVYEGDMIYDVPEGKGGALFVKEGSVLVTMKPQKYILEKQHDYIVDVYPSKTVEASFTLFEDDGFTYDYEKGFGCFTKIETKNRSEKGFELVINPRTGSFPGRPDNGHDIMKNSVPKIASEQPERNMTVVLHGQKASEILLDGKSVDFSYDGKDTTFIAQMENRGEKRFTYSIKL